MKLGLAVRVAPALGAIASAASAEAQAVTPAEGEGSGILMAVGLVVALLVVIGVAVKIFDLRRKREAEGVHLQAQVSDALLREEDLFGLPITATARVPVWSGTPATIEVSGQVPTSESHNRVLRIVREEAGRIRPDVEIEDRVMVVPSMAMRAA